MIISLKRWIHRAKFIIIFMVCTYLVFEILTTVTAWISPVDKYREPHGKAVKVFNPNAEMLIQSDAFADRLLLFFWLGE